MPNSKPRTDFKIIYVLRRCILEIKRKREGTEKVNKSTKNERDIGASGDNPLY